MVEESETLDGLAVSILPDGLVGLIDDETDDVLSGEVGVVEVVGEDMRGGEEDPGPLPGVHSLGGTVLSSETDTEARREGHDAETGRELLGDEGTGGGHEHHFALRVPPQEIVHDHGCYVCLAQPCRQTHQHVLPQRLLHHLELVLSLLFLPPHRVLPLPLLPLVPLHHPSLPSLPPSPCRPPSSRTGPAEEGRWVGS